MVVKNIRSQFEENGVRLPILKKFESVLDFVRSDKGLFKTYTNRCVERAQQFPDTSWKTIVIKELANAALLSSLPLHDIALPSSEPKQSLKQFLDKIHDFYNIPELQEIWKKEDEHSKDLAATLWLIQVASSKKYQQVPLSKNHIRAVMGVVHRAL